MAIQRSLTLLALVLASVAWTYSVSAQDEDVERCPKRSTWQVGLTLDTPNLVPPAVQWTILDKDPVPGFRARVKRAQSYHRKRLERAKDEAEKKQERSIQMTVDWNLGFKVVTGDKVYLLASSPGVSHSITSNGPDGRKWIVTKIVQIKRKPVCWCLPIEVKMGKTNQVTLTEDNIFGLEAVFDETIRESSQTE